MENIPILLTSSVIAYDKGVALQDTDKRINLALQSVEEWQKINPNIPLVLCDGSSFDFTTIILQRFPNSIFECLPFENDQEKVQKFGRGYGEGEIISYALKKSKIINDKKIFAKCSSKLWVENFYDCVHGHTHPFMCKGVFLNTLSPLKKTILSYIDTRFYVSSTDFYLDHFSNAHLKIGKRKGYGLENSFLEIVKEKNMKNIIFNTPPVICGVGGGTGIYYKNSGIRKIKDKIRSKFNQIDPNFRDLFI